MQPPSCSGKPPVLWSIAGMDSGGGAGLSADQRAADAMGVHLCPVTACITAQHSMGVEAVFPVLPAQLQAQFDALAHDLPPAAIKTGLLGDVRLIEATAALVRRLRERQPGLALVVDPVLGASAGGAAFSNDAVLEAYRRHLLPLATLITPNRAEALRLLGRAPRHDGPDGELPELAAALRAAGAQAVVITGGDAPHARWAIDWLDTPHAQGWLCSARVPTRHHHGSGCAFGSAAAAALAHGHVQADAAVLAKMLVTQALKGGHPVGKGPGPVKAGACAPSAMKGTLPWLGIGQALPWQLTHGEGGHAPLFAPFLAPPDGLYGIVPDAAAVEAAVQAGVRCVQLRHKPQDGAAAQIARSVAACRAQGAQFFVNDHWEAALRHLPPHPPSPEDKAAAVPLGIHLGQEDLLSLDDAGRARLLAARHHLVLGLSSHSMWELARAAGCGASLIACGPVQPTTTKDMPWRPQGEDNLRWWVTHSPAPVVAIGGLLTTEDLRRHAACGPAALCVVRGLGQTPEDIAARLPGLQDAVDAGRQDEMSAHAAHLCRGTLKLPHPVLPDDNATHA